MTRIIEAGHYYKAKGPTLWSVVAWEIMSNIKQLDDKTLLMVDDVHTVEQMSVQEKTLSTEPFNPSVDLFVYESELCSYGKDALQKLASLSKKKKARKNGNGKWFCSGIPLTNEMGLPLCILYDVGLTLFKSARADKAINILPYFYEEEQRNLIRIIQKILPEFSIKVILFDLEGKYWEMPL
ncbi:MAG: hypothetical protein HOE19_01985 [Candidatus Komeilibacteria bacterium]|mgnify:CR=1 FL=1|jgi:hypothetical protein|nr:hypothetical protein [Candidatus Komeilibacteria bacterium]MBT4447450.1 hypothetical protein [Candidatus Komeilibacteria bacterium]